MCEEKYMRRAIGLAKKGEGWCHPNPMVGAVIVRDGRIIGEGYHERCGELHAERNAIASLTESAEGADIYVTLEPCCHYGKTPPCTEAIIENKIAHVIVGSADPNPKVAGGGVRKLREAGIRVTENFLRDECDALNPVFFHYISTKTPYVVMKYAMTADGKIATKTGASKWISGEASREKVQQMRHACMGIMAGIGTVLADDPMLNCRIPGGRDPVRIICDSSLRIPAGSNICRTADRQDTIIACSIPELKKGMLTEEDAETPAEHPGKLTDAGAGGTGEDTACRVLRLLRAGCRILNVPDQSGRRTDLKLLMRMLGEMEIDSVLLEGGGGLNESALRAGIVSEIRAFVAPKIFGGPGRPPVAGTGVELPGEAWQLEMKDAEKVGEDLMICYRPVIR